MRNLLHTFATLATTALVVSMQAPTQPPQVANVPPSATVQGVVRAVPTETGYQLNLVHCLNSSFSMFGSPITYQANPNVTKQTAPTPALTPLGYKVVGMATHIKNCSRVDIVGDTVTVTVPTKDPSLAADLEGMFNKLIEKP